MQDRDRIPYTPGEASINTVRVIITEAGHADPSAYEISGAYICLGARPCSVGDVAEKVIERRAGEQRTGNGDGRSEAFVQETLFT
jgi:hypothetical protein